LLTETKIWPNVTYPVKKYLFLFFKIIIFEGKIFLNPKRNAIDRTLLLITTKYLI
jgi:hypothetical protein